MRSSSPTSPTRGRSGTATGSGWTSRSSAATRATHTRSSWTSVDVVTCNPPYIPDDQVPVDPEVRDHDPREALYGGSADGLGLPLAMAARAAALLRDEGTLVMEHADTQGDALPRALAGTGDWDKVVDHVDLLGRPRCVVATRHRVRGRDKS